MEGTEGLKLREESPLGSVLQGLVVGGVFLNQFWGSSL